MKDMKIPNYRLEISTKPVPTGNILH